MFNFDNIGIVVTEMHIKLKLNFVENIFKVTSKMCKKSDISQKKVNK